MRRLKIGLFIAFLALILTSSQVSIIQPVEEGKHLVIYVIDGDTIVLESGEVVRYLGIDTPETVHPSKDTKCYGPEASERNRQLVEDKWVRLETDQTDRDAYGRLLRYVYVGHTFVNAKLVEDGYAYSSYYSPDTKYYGELLALELDAEKEGRGLWSVCRQILRNMEN